MTGWQIIQQVPAGKLPSDEEMTALLEGNDFVFPLVYNNEKSAWYWANVINDILAYDERYPSVRVTVRLATPPITKAELDRKARTLFP